MTRRLVSLAVALGLPLPSVLLTALPGDSGIVLNTSRALGGTDVTDAINHIVLFASLTLAWGYALDGHLFCGGATRIVIVAVLLLGTITELMQAGIAERGAGLLDLVANGCGVALAALILRFRFPC